MDAEAVEEALARERDEVLDRQRRVEHGELDLNRASIGFDVRLRRHRLGPSGATPHTPPRTASSAPAGSARRRPPRRRDRAAPSGCAARTRTAQSLSANAVFNTGAAAARPHDASALSAAARALVARIALAERIRLGERRPLHQVASACRAPAAAAARTTGSSTFNRSSRMAAALGDLSFTSDSRTRGNHPLVGVGEHRLEPRQRDVRRSSSRARVASAGANAPVRIGIQSGEDR